MSTKQDALDFFSDLIPQETLFDDTAPLVRPKKVAPKWRTAGIRAIVKVCTCKSCGTRVLAANPSLLLKQEQVDFEGNIIATNSTDTPSAAQIFEVRAEDVVVEYIDLDHSAFCFACIDSQNPSALVAMFQAQASDKLNKKLGKSSLSPEALQKQADAEKELFDLLDNLS